MNLLIEKQNQIKADILEQQKKIFYLENQLMDIEQELTTFSDNIILDNLQLSHQQQQIIDATEDNILVVACPGSGKTHTLISRYVKLTLDKLDSSEEKDKINILPEEVLLITFTKKAGMEMLNRLNKIVPNKLSTSSLTGLNTNGFPYHVGSLHGLGYKVLQEYNDINYTILDEKDVREYLYDIINNNPTIQQLDTDDLCIIKNKIQLIIDHASITYPCDLKLTLKKFNLSKYYKEFNNIYKLYQSKKKKEHLIDFNDLMIQFSKFLDDPKSAVFKDKIKYIFFDEYQDVNPIQNYILLKLSEKSKLMVVGDDAQSIYAFRGSSIKYILDFNNNVSQNKTTKMYLLGENYRSTPAIVDFCQNIISHNANQFKKEVYSKHANHGCKPHVIGFKSQTEQYKWIVEDIIKKTGQGIKLSDMVILARKNHLLNDIELHLMGNKIQTVKHIGLSLLDKSHIKDFLAFITIIINPKSSIHWKRIISLHNGYDIKKANIILDKSLDDLLNSLKTYTDLFELYELFINFKKIKKDIDKAKVIIKYLEKLWISKKENNIDDKIADIYNLLCYLNNLSFEQFITNLYLNQEIETDMENVLYLTTIHGAKGLEWEYVYIIDMNSKDFPLIKSKYYLEELEDVDEERRLFYVAASRAKKYLFITYHVDLHPESQVQLSPLLREIKPELYTGYNVVINSFKPTLIISKDVQNYLRFIGYNKIYDQLHKLTNTRYYANKPFDIPKDIEKLPHKIIIGNFIDYLIAKILQINYPKKIKKFDLNIMHKDTKFPHKIYLEYIDSQTDWRNILEHIFYIATYKMNNIDLTPYHDFLINETAFNYYLEIEKGICKIINLIKPKQIYTHYCVSHGSVRAEIDILCDDTIIEIKTSLYLHTDIATISNLAQVLLYSYLLKKREHIINKIILYNPLNGEVNTFDISDFNLIKFKKSVYKE